MDGVSVAGFDWDEGNREKCAKHGVSIEEIESVFAAEPGIGPDPFDAAIETRFRAIGRAQSGRHVFVVFTLRRIRGDTYIRPIGARYMHQKEVRHYERQQGQ